jgi:uncharacterized membrane protein
MEQSFDSLTLDLQNMDARLTEMEEKIDSINTKLTQVVDAILGNPLTKHGGFISEMDTIKAKIEELEKKANSLEAFKSRVYWTIGIAVAVLMVAQYLTGIYANLKH